MKRFLISLGASLAIVALANAGSQARPPGGGGATIESTTATIKGDGAGNGVAASSSDTLFPATLPAASGVNLTALNATNLGSGTVPDARFPATLPAASGINLTALNATNMGSGTLPDARFPATLPAASGVNLTALNATNLASGTIPDARFPATLPAASGINLTALNATNLGSGTVPDARFPATLPAASGVNLTALNATNLGSGSIPDARFPAPDVTAVPNESGGWKDYYVTGSDFTTSSTTAVDITGMVTGTLSAVSKYEFEVVMMVVNAADTTGVKYAVHGGGTGTAATVNAIFSGTSSSATAAATASMMSIDTLTAAGVTYSSGTGQVYIRGFFTTNSTGTVTFSMQIAKVTSGTLTVKVGSVLRVKKAHT